MSRSILVCFTWSFSNIGDIGITPGLLNLLEQHIPGTQVTLVANSHADETGEYLATRFPSCKLIATPFRSEKPTPEFMKAFENADLILYNSGTTLSFGRWKRDWDQTMRFAMPLVMARDAGKPYGIYCQSFELFAWPSNFFFRDLLSDADFIFARDTNSLEYLKSLGVAPPVLEYGPDATFGFDLHDEAWADNFMKEYELEPRGFITLTIRSSRQGFIDEEREGLHAAKMRQLATEWIERTGLPVLVCPEVKHEIEPARKLILEPLPEDIRKHVRFKEDFWLPEQAFSVFARARIIVSMEMHSIIMGLAAGTPVLHPRFVEAGRKAWMLRDLGVEEWLFDLDKDPAEDVIAAALEIHNDFPGALEKLDSAMDFVHKRQTETMAIVKESLE
jgi:polysaccharide pyruvyl transferase WcaK-like protein